jgi:hypothetical protein
VKAMFIMENQFRRISANKGGGGGGRGPPIYLIYSSLQLWASHMEIYIHFCSPGFCMLETLTIRVSKLSLTDSGPKFVNTENKLEEKKNSMSGKFISSC